ncbi:MAG: membrane protein [Acidimicrobiia bacterium]|nr:MAG: membrane protein [Acidimicrobiia bacterium]
MDDATEVEADTGEIPYEPHIGATRQYWRDIVLGVNDGIVSIFLLVAGVVGGGLDPRQVFLTAVAGAVAGAVSMASGEFLATKSQDEVLDAELRLERIHIRHHRDKELAQLREMFAAMGIEGEDLDTVVSIFDKSDRALLEAMKALEFGAVDSERRSPFKAMAFSGLLFLVGSLPPALPFALAVDVNTGLLWASILTAVALVGVGVAKTRVTRGNPLVAGLENLAIAGLGGVVAYLIGSAVGAGPV